jgi:hypothetical protein
MHNDLEMMWSQNFLSPFEGCTLQFVLEGQRKTSVRVVGVPAEIQPGLLPDNVIAFAYCFGHERPKMSEC